QAGATVNAVEVLGSSEFKPSTSGTGTGGTLPKTGDDALRLGALGILLVALGLGLGVWFKMPLPRRLI
ncbi:MAG TPA: LPXTG cell wall anchor domain-containing protein, partial [Acidimicrobiales bacterium]|nr:LPXTG cell wall anchor domain-containing protein [Acidimicrobiales bacterium]